MRRYTVLKILAKVQNKEEKSYLFKLLRCEEPVHVLVGQLDKAARMRDANTSGYRGFQKGG